MSLNVLHIINSLGLGGAQVCLKGIVENIDANQVNFTIYPLRPLNEIVINGTIIQHKRRNYSPLKLLDIIRTCKKYNIDLIHAHLNKAAIIAILASFFCKAKVIVHEHGQVTENNWQFILYRLLLRLFSFKVSSFITVSDFTNNTIANKCGISKEKIHTIYNAVDLEKFKYNHSARQSIRDDLGISENEIVIGYTGRLHNIKGTDLLPPALDLLHKQGYRCHLVLAGHGNLLAGLTEKAAALKLSEYIHFLGFRNDVSDVISSFDIAVQPSRKEAFGISVIEYYAAGIPVICSDTQGLAEIARDNITALVLNALTPDEIAKRTAELLSNDRLKTELAQNAAEFCREFSIQVQIQKIFSLYNQILQ